MTRLRAHPSQAVALAALASSADAAPPATFGAIIGRIEEAVEEETVGIRTDIRFDIKASNARKSRYLYELTRAMKGVGETEFLAEHRDGLKRLREKLARNEAAIRAHLNAVNEVATLMQNAIQHAEADGTYSAGEFGYGAMIKFVGAAIWICAVDARRRLLLVPDRPAPRPTRQPRSRRCSAASTTSRPTSSRCR